MSGSFTRAMQPQPGGQPPGQPGGPQKMVQLNTLVQQAHEMMQRLIQELAKVPGLNQQQFQQGVQMMQQATQIIASAMPKGQGQPGQGGAQPGGPPAPGGAPPGGMPGG